MTIELARRLAASSWPSVNDAIGDEAVRSIVNWLGCALAGTRAACDEVTPVFSRLDIEATVLGVGGPFTAVDAATMTAVGADSLCYVDTHAATALSPAAVVGGALLPLAEHLGAAGAHFVHAYLLGVEIACRAAMALPAETMAQGFVPCTALGAAAACVKLAGLDEPHASQALERAWVAGLGGDGSDNAAGGAARSGLLAALTNQDDGIAMPAASDGAHTSRDMRPTDAILDGWNDVWQCARIGYHAYPCAMFLHPVVEASLQLKRMHHLTLRQIEAVRVRMAPRQLTGNRGNDPSCVAEARHSIEYAAAVALIDGEAGLAQFEAPRLRSARVRELRTKIEVAADEKLPDTAAVVSVDLVGGETLERQVRCALGHPLRPLSDHDLSEKFRSLAAEVLATDQAERLLGLAWNIRALPDVGGLVRASVPEDVFEASALPGSPLIPR